MISESQKRANMKYRKKTERQVNFTINRTTRPLMLAWMEQQENIQGYLRHLIAADMKARGMQTDGKDGE